jgi:hypothetical protein
MGETARGVKSGSRKVYTRGKVEVKELALTDSRHGCCLVEAYLLPFTR